MRWLLLDSIVAIEKGKKAHTRSRIFRNGVTPELLMMEAMAQTGGLLLGAEHDFANNLIFAKIEKASFGGRYEMQTVLDIQAVSDQLKPEGAWIDASIQQQGNEIAAARFLLMNAGPLVPGKNKSITFHDAFMQHFSVRAKVRASAPQQA